MSKFGMKIADETVYGIVSPDQALELVEKVMNQYFGEYWTQHKPRCPLCDEALSDTEKHMNRPVGECTNEKCDSTIQIADFFGKIKDILGEWDHVKDTWKEEVKAELRIKSSHRTTGARPAGEMFHTGASTDFGTNEGINFTDDDVALTLVDEDTVFVW